MKVLFLLLSCICTFLTAEEAAPPSLVDLSRSPIPRVAGSVNLVSGNFIDQATHQETSGVDPYHVATSYTSSSGSGSLSYAWDYYHATTFEVVYQSEPYTGVVITLKDAGGATYRFECDNSFRNMKPVLTGSGYTLMGSISAPVLRDVKRVRIKRAKHRDVWKVKLGDGTKRLYERIGSQGAATSGVYHIVKERLPSGNRRFFSYDKQKNLKTIKTVSSDGKYTINETSFKKLGHIVYVRTSDNMQTSFHLKPLKNEQQTVGKILSTGVKETTYAYKKGSMASQQRLSRKSHTNGSAQRVLYYEKGKNHVGIHTIPVSSSTHFLHGRVKKLQINSFPNAPLFTLYNFYYKVWKAGYFRAVAQECDGYSLRILWNPEKRAIWSGYYDQKESRLFAERYIWGTGNDEGRLIRRILSDENKRPLFYREFAYDKIGNVTRESYQGRFTGARSSPLKRTTNGCVTGAELFVLFAEYSRDGRNLKVAESDPLGNWTYYEYEPKRNLLTARFTCDQKRIIQREFFIYNSAAVCIKSIVDNGSSRDRKDHTSVTRQMIVRVKPRLVMPYFGSVDEKRTYFWTKESGEKLSHIEKNFRDNCGRVSRSQIIDAKGVVQKTYHYGYDGANRVIDTIDPTGRRETVTYDSSERIASRTTPEATIFYAYDLLDRPIEEKKVFPDGSTESTCTQYDLTGKTVTKIDARGRETTTYQDNCGRLVEKTLPAFSAASGGIRHNRILKTYTGSKEITTLPNGCTTKIIRSALGKPLKSVNALGAITRYYYDLKGRLIKQIDPCGLTTVTTYDALDRVIATEQFDANTNYGRIEKRYVGSDLVEEKYPTKVVRYTYDLFGQKTSQTTVDTITNKELTVSYSYDSLHRLSKTHFHDTDVEECLRYDAADHVIEKRVVASDGTLLKIETTTYDLAGRVVEQGVGMSGTIAKTQTIYGAYGLPEKIIQPDGSVTQIRYDPLWKDSLGMLYLKKTTIDPRGVVTEEKLDANDQQRDILVKNCLGETVSHRGVSVSDFGKPVLMGDDVIANGKAIDTIYTSLDYDKLDQLTVCTLAARTRDEAIYRYVYDSAGRKIQDVKPSGVSIHSAYDAKGRLIRTSSSDGSIDYQYSYNIQSLPERIVNGVQKQTTVRTYDGLGHLIQEHLENDLSISYAVDVSGRLQSITYPDATTSSYSYRHGLFDSIARKDYRYQVNDRDVSGLITSATLPGSAGLLKQAVDIMGRRTLIEHGAFTEERTSFDQVGNCLSRTIDGIHEAFSYDSLSQLTSDAGKNVSFDSLHRRTQKEGVASSHNARHQMVTLGTEQFYYDTDGRRTKDAHCSYTYDALDRLIAIEDASTRVDFAYDAFNRRMSASTVVKGSDSSKKELFLWQQDCEIGSYANGQAQSLRLLGEGLGGEIGAAVAFEINDDLIIPIHDLCGNVRACLNRYGDVVEKLSYTAFGPENSNTGISPWTYASKRQDPHFGLIFFGQRFYDPHTATWLTQDPLGFSAGPNLYAYVKNNPLTRFDVFGLFDFGCIGDFLETAFCTVSAYICSAFDNLFFSNDSSLSVTSEPGNPSYNTTATEGSSSLIEASLGEGQEPERENSLCAELTGISHGIVDFAIFSLGIPDLEKALSALNSICTIEGLQVQPNSSISDVLMQRGMAMDISNAIHQSFRAGTITALGIGSMAVGGWQMARGLVRTSQLMSISQRVPTTIRLGNQTTWPSPANGRAVINGIEYTVHALERMAPRGLIQRGTEIVSRGVPPSVVENAMNFGIRVPGNSPQEIVHIFENVRVVASSDSSRVITVITTGR